MAVLVALLGSTAVLAYETGRRSVVPTATPVSVPADPVATPAQAVPGPVLVDGDGTPLPADIAKSVRIVYTAMDAGDLDPVHAAYSAAGSDDWIATEQHLANAAIRNDVLAALRTTPVHDGTTYTWSADGTDVEFGWSSLGAGTGAGLLSIAGPWIEDTGETSAAGTSTPTTSAVEETWAAPTDCTGGSIDQPSEGYPCTDPATGRGVTYDGTVGAHGLKPCPHGTEIPSDPSEPTRNAATGEICGWDG